MAKTAIKGIAAFLLPVVFVLGALWWLPDASHAADLVPGPVDEIPDVPSRALSSLTGSPMGDQNLVDLWRALKSGTVNIPDVPKPITAGGAITRGASSGAVGGALGLAFTGGWLITDGTLALYGATTGTEPLGPSCAMDGWVQVAVEVLYVFSAPDCTAGFTNPNNDIPVTVSSMTYSGLTYAYNHFEDKPQPSWSYDLYCYIRSGSGGGGATLQGKAQSGAWIAVAPGAGSSSECGVGQWKVAAWAPTLSSSLVASPALRFVVGSTVVAEMTESRADKDRRLDCVVTWPGGSTTSATATGTYTEGTGLSPRSISNLCNDAYVSKPGHGPTLTPTEIEIGSTPDGGTRSVISEQPVPDFGPDQRRAFEEGNGHGLVLEKVVSTFTKSCMTWEADCAGWWEATDEGTTPGTYRCTYGGQQIALTECGPYRYTFDTRTSAPTVTDPVTGTQTPWSAKPNTGNSLDPGIGPGTGASPADACFETGWTDVANPVDWVLVPVKCALVWAFVPRTSVTTAVQTQVTTAWDDTFLGQVGAVIPPLLTVPTGDGCSGPHVHFELTWPMTMNFSAYPLSACEAPASYLAAMAKVIASFLLIGYTIWGVSRRLSAVVNAPGLGPGH